MLDAVASDLRFTMRMLRKSPLFTITAVVCISLGSGAVTTVFSAMNALVLRTLPGASDVGRLVRLERRQPGATDGMSASYLYYEHLRDRSRTLEAVAAWGKASLTLRGGPGAGTAIYGNFVSGNIFTVLGVRPALGRFFLSDEDRTEGTHPVIVVSDGFWRSHLGADSSAVGREIAVNGYRFTLIGVTPATFQGLDAPIRTDAWIPLHMQRQMRPNRDALNSASVTWLRLCGRLKAGMRGDVARRELSTLTAGFAAEATEPASLRTYSDLRLSPLSALPPEEGATLTGFLGLLLGAAALVLLIASVNVAAMLSARAVARRREMAVRAALGAARARLVRQLLTEILVLFALGGCGGIALALVATSTLERLPIPAEVPIALELSPDPRVFTFALLVSLLTGAIVGLAPARRAARADITAQLRDGSAASSARRSAMGNALVVGQLALSLLLLVGAGLFTRALGRGTRMDPGITAAGVATVALDVELWGYDDARGRAFFRALRERVAALPGVTAVSYTTILPLALRSSVDDIQVAGAAARGGAGDRRARRHRLAAGDGRVVWDHRVLGGPAAAGNRHSPGPGRAASERAAPDRA